MMTKIINLMEWLGYNIDNLIKIGLAIIAIGLILRFIIILMVI